MTPLERTCICGASYRIETDDLAWANRLMAKFEKKHSQCRPSKVEKLIIGHPRTKKGHIKK